MAFNEVGEMVEWFKAPVLKTGVGVPPPRVRIPLSPPLSSVFMDLEERVLNIQYNVFYLCSSLVIFIFCCFLAPY